MGCNKLEDTNSVPTLEMSQFGQLLEKGWASIMDNELRSAMPKAIFPNDMKLPSSQLFKIGKGFYLVPVNQNVSN